jgi:hypothetical protein
MGLRAVPMSGCISAAKTGLNVSRNWLNDHDPPARPSLMASLAVGNFKESLFQNRGLKPRAASEARPLPRRARAP